MDMIGKVRRMRLRDQLFLSEIAKRTGLSRNTVKKLLRAPSDVASKYERVKLAMASSPRPSRPCIKRSQPTVIAPSRDGQRPCPVAQIQAQGYCGGYSAVTDYIRRWRVESAVSPAKAFVPNSMRDDRRIYPSDASCHFFHGRAATICVVRFLLSLNNYTQ